MLSSEIAKFNLFSNVENPKQIVFCDFDETYYPHKLNKVREQYIYELEDYLAEKSKIGELIVGWVTGSDSASILEKLNRGKFRYLPHFIASNLGTEITYYTEEHFGEQDSDWNSRLNNSVFTEKTIEYILNHLQELDKIYLSPQTQLGSSRYKRNFYYQQQNELSDKKNLLTIETVCKKYGIAVNINRCNPLAGDPEDSYDVDFIPLGTGKEKVVQFMLDKYNVQHENTFAFGDSGNDLRMLKAVKHGYLVENATKEAKAAHSKVTVGEYAQGIISILKSNIT
ncbi:HAD-IIB family hydrolase [Paraliobacillus sediminis]|uniref:HAD-IIB family hydrolase n=1 Tax=Paraliobacillus sediminis TaxID=1885916 RepID=UPI000E3E81B2|nr:HAD-IIB family hydrolase [Paraliobacillus sediminis]